MKTIKLHLLKVIVLVAMSSCVYLKHPTSYKLTRGDWGQDTTILKFNELPNKVKDTLASFYEAYYNGKYLHYLELISLDPGVNICFIEYVTFPSETVILHTPGYYFRIGGKKYFFDYRKFYTPIVYYENNLYYFSGKYSNETDRFSFESQSDYENMFFVKYSLVFSNLKKHQKSGSNDCDKKSGYNFYN